MIVRTPSFLCAKCAEGAKRRRTLAEIDLTFIPADDIRYVLWQTVREIRCERCRRWIPDVDIIVKEDELVI